MTDSHILLYCFVRSSRIINKMAACISQMQRPGVILLFFLCKKFPLFQANDDVEALMEIAVVLGRRRMERAATLHSATQTAYELTPR